MKFLHPAWLWALVALPFAYAFILRAEKGRLKRFERFAAPAIWRSLAPELDPAARPRKARWLLAAAAFGMLALARPQWGTHEESVKATGLDIMVVLDVSNSMEVEDVIPSRLKKARHLVKNLVDRLKGDRVGLVAFAASSYVACPLTTDTDYLLETLQILGPRMVSNQGTDIGIGLDTARKALERGAEEGSAPDGKVAARTDAAATQPPPTHVVLLISDGEDQEDGAIASAKTLREAGAKVFVIGIGTEKGAPVPVRDESGALLTYKKDRKGQPVVSTFHPDALMQVAQAAGGRYFNATSEETEVDQILQEMGSLDRTDYAERKFVVYEDRFQFPLAIAVLLLLLELSLPVRRLRRPGAGGAASVAASALGLGLLLSPPAGAASVLGHAPSWRVYRDNREGVRAFRDGRIDDAQKSIGQAQAKDPARAELDYNQGVVQMGKNEAEEAARAFQQSAKGAAQAGDAGLESRSLYNLGGVLAKKKDVENATQAYIGAIDAARRAKDEALEKDARKNLQLLVRRQQEEQQKKKSGDQEKNAQNDPKSKDKAGEQKDPQGSSGQESGKGKSGPEKGEGQDGEGEAKDREQAAKDGEGPKEKSYRQGGKRRFESQSLSKEDAERVMSELSNREKELQGKLKKQHGNSSQNPSKDW